MSLFDGMSTKQAAGEQRQDSKGSIGGMPEAATASGNMFSGMSMGGPSAGADDSGGGGPFGGGSAFGFLNSAAATDDPFAEAGARADGGAREAFAAPEPTESAFNFLGGGGGTGGGSSSSTAETGPSAFGFLSSQSDPVAQTSAPEPAATTSAFGFLSGGGGGGGGFGGASVEPTSSFPSTFASSLPAAPAATPSFDSAALLETSTVRKKTRKAVLPGHASRPADGPPPPPPEIPKVYDDGGAAPSPAQPPPPPLAEEASSRPSLFEGLQAGSAAAAEPEHSQDAPVAAASGGLFGGLQAKEPQPPPPPPPPAEDEGKSRIWKASSVTAQKPPPPPSAKAIQKFAKVRSTGRVGEILQQDLSDDAMTYKLLFSDGILPAQDWFGKGDVEQATVAESTESQAASATFRPPARVEETKPQPPPPPPPEPKGPDLKSAFNVGGVQQWMGLKSKESNAAHKAVLNKLASNVDVSARTAGDIAARREKLAATEAEQNRLVDSECFEEAGALDPVIQELKDAVTHLLEDVAVAARETEALARDLLGLTRERQKFAEEALCKVKGLQREGEDTMSDMDARSEKKIVAESARLESERKRMDLGRSHISKDSENLGEEQRQVQEAIDQQGSEHVKEREHAAEQRDGINEEIRELQRKLEQKMEQRVALDEIVGACDIRISSIRSKFEKQLSRLEEKQSKHEEAKREVEQDAQQVDHMAAELEREKEVAKQTSLQRRRHVREIKRESRKLRRLRHMTVRCEHKRSVWQKLLDPHHVTLNEARQKWDTSQRKATEVSENSASKEAEVAKLRGQIDTIKLQVPSLEAEKKMAVSSRSFKEAGRIAEEIKRREEERKGLEVELESLQAELTTAREQMVESRQDEESAQAALLECEAICAKEELRIIRRQVMDLEALSKGLPVGSSDQPLFEQEMRLLQRAADQIADKYRIDASSLEEIPSEKEPDLSEEEEDEEEEEEEPEATREENGFAEKDREPATSSDASPEAPHAAESTAGTTEARAAASASAPVDRPVTRAPVVEDPEVVRQRVAELSQKAADLKAREGGFDEEINKAVDNDEYDRAEELEEERKTVASELEEVERELAEAQEDLVASEATVKANSSAAEPAASTEKVSGSAFGFVASDSAAPNGSDRGAEVEEASELEEVERELVGAQEDVVAREAAAQANCSTAEPAPSTEKAAAEANSSTAEPAPSSEKDVVASEAAAQANSSTAEPAPSTEKANSSAASRSGTVEKTPDPQDSSGSAKEESKDEAEEDVGSAPSAFGFVAVAASDAVEAPDDPGVDTNDEALEAAEVTAETEVSPEVDADEPPAAPASAFGFLAGGAANSDEAPADSGADGGVDASAHGEVAEDSPAAAFTFVASSDAQVSGSAFGVVASDSAAPNGSDRGAEVEEAPASAGPSSFGFMNAAGGDAPVETDPGAESSGAS